MLEPAANGVLWVDRRDFLDAVKKSILELRLLKCVALLEFWKDRCAAPHRRWSFAS